MQRITKFLIAYLSFIVFIVSTNPNNQVVSKNNSSSIDSINETINEVIETKSSSDIKVDEPIIEEISLKKMNLLILSGHASLQKDPGAVSQGRYEYAYAKDLTQQLSNHLKTNYPHINVILEDAPYKAAEEALYIGKVQPDYVISIHFNAGGDTGFEIITPLKNEKLTFATEVVKVLRDYDIPIRPLSIYSRSTSTNRIERKVNQPLNGSDYYAVINKGASMGIISEILEIEFIDNAQAMQRYEQNKTKYVDAIAKSINKYYIEEYNKN